MGLSTWLSTTVKTLQIGAIFLISVDLNLLLFKIIMSFVCDINYM